MMWTYVIYLLNIWCVVKIWGLTYKWLRWFKKGWKVVFFFFFWSKRMTVLLFSLSKMLKHIIQSHLSYLDLILNLNLLISSHSIMFLLLFMFYSLVYSVLLLSVHPFDILFLYFNNFYNQIDNFHLYGF